MTTPCWMELSHEARLRGEVAEIIREFGATMSTVSGIPNKTTREDNRRLGEMVSQVMFEQKVAPAIRVRLLADLLDAGIAPDARFGGLFVNGQKQMVDGSGRGRRSLLMMAVAHRFALGVQLLLERGASIAASKEDYGYHVADQAVANADAACLRLVLARATLKDFYGAKYLAKDGTQTPHRLFDMTSSDNAGWNWDGDNVEVICLLLDAGLSREGLLEKAVAVARDCPSIIDALVEGGCDFREHDFAAVTKAASHGRVRMLERLFELGAAPTIKTPGGATLAQCARKHPEVKELLRSWKASHAVSVVIDSDDGIAFSPVKKTHGIAL